MKLLLQIRQNSTFNIIYTTKCWVPNFFNHCHAFLEFYSKYYSGQSGNPNTTTQPQFALLKKTVSHLLIITSSSKISLRTSGIILGGWWMRVGAKTVAKLRAFILLMGACRATLGTNQTAETREFSYKFHLPMQVLYHELQRVVVGLWQEQQGVFDRGQSQILIGMLWNGKKLPNCPVSEVSCLRMASIRRGWISKVTKGTGRIRR